MANIHGINRHLYSFKGITMQLKHHIKRKFNESMQAPLWKKILIIILIIAMPLFFSLVRLSQIQQAEVNSETQDPSLRSG